MNFTQWTHLRSLAPRPSTGRDGRLELFFSMSKGEVGDLSRRLKGELQLDPGTSRNYSLAVECVVYNLLVAMLVESERHTDCVVIVSRDRNSYRRTPKVYGYQHIAYENLTTVLDLFRVIGLIEQQLGMRSEGYSKGLRTKIWPTQLFKDLAANAILNIAVLPINGRGRLVLKDESGTLQKYIMMGDRKRKSEELQGINNANAHHTFSYQPRVAAIAAGNLALAADDAAVRLLDHHDLLYDRIFNGDWQHGGRIYADFQNLEREERRSIQIDGEPSVELDFSAFHPSMLYHLRGLPLPNKPYLVAGISAENRPAAKVALLCVFNAVSRRAATSAVIKELKDRGIKVHGGLRVSDLIDLLLDAHGPISRDFFSGVGTRLQFLDSEIAIRVLTVFTEQRRPCLCIHDSFLVKAEDEALLQLTMEKTYREVLRSATFAPYGGWVPEIARK